MRPPAITSLAARLRVACVALAMCACACAVLPGRVDAIGAPAEGQPLEGAQVLALVNEQRAANGIPPLGDDDQAFAQSWCPDEEAPFGLGEAGRVSAPEDDYWSADRTPYSTAPLHQFLIYNPAYSVAGDVHTPDGTDCMGLGEAGAERLPTVLLGGVEPGMPGAALTPRFYAFVNERGPQAAVPRELAIEGPTTPQQQLGEPASEVTGPQISLYVLGFGVDPTPVTLSLSTASGRAVAGAQIARDFDGGVLVPPPLQTGVAYELSVVWAAASGQTATQTLAFATAARSNAVSIRVLARSSRGVVLAVRSSSPTAHVSVTGRARLLRPLPASTRSSRLRLALGAGAWRACVASGGGESGYEPAERCVSFSISSPSRASSPRGRSRASHRSPARDGGHAR
jgi:hypothetical protein